MKLGRPPLLEAHKKAQIAALRLRPEERALLESAAKKTEKKLSAWMRAVLLTEAHRELTP